MIFKKKILGFHVSFLLQMRNGVMSQSAITHF